MIANFLQQVASGLVLGSIYALVAAGLTLVYGTMRILNFAHGEFYMLGGYMTFFAAITFGLPPAVALAVAAIVVFAIGAAFHRLAIRPLLGGDGAMFSTIVVTLGASLFIQNAALQLWGERFQSIPYYIDGILTIGSFRLPYQRVLIFVCTILILAGVGLFLRYSRLGFAIRAVAQDSEAATALGVPAARIHTFAFGLASGLAALGAGLLAPIYAVNPWMGVPLSLKAFVVVILAGLGSFKGAIIAGLLLGVVESVGISLTSSEWQDVISFATLIVVIWFRPWGLFGQPSR
ncbi:branched-chain amino acid ABC transporter permease [Mesorhizobium sp. 2RAF21]|uniref:branched-chain amino acid ABC transporter permease n=1 Tax=Mesorhizobium sp. 2RAF21 TaxID=3232995 RepID=UPI003F9D3A4A